MSLRAHLSGLRQRFDLLALRPPAAAAGEVDWPLRQPAAWSALQHWCWQGAVPGEGRRTLAVAALDGPDTASALACADALARQRDGSLRLEALGRAAGLAWRLQLKLQDALWWRTRRPDDPWDAGWALATPAALAQWRAGFQPRRATLVLADCREAAALAPALAALTGRSAGLRHPVRWLWVGGDVGARAAQGQQVTRIRLT